MASGRHARTLHRVLFSLFHGERGHRMLRRGWWHRIISDDFGGRGSAVRVRLHLVDDLLRLLFVGGLSDSSGHTLAGATGGAHDYLLAVLEDWSLAFARRRFGALQRRIERAASRDWGKRRRRRVLFPWYRTLVISVHASQAAAKTPAQSQTPCIIIYIISFRIITRTGHRSSAPLLLLLSHSESQHALSL